MSTLLIGDCVEKIREIPDNSINCIVTTIPWGDVWSYSRFPSILKMDVPGCSSKWNFPSLAHEMYRVLTPGGVLCWHMGDEIIKDSESVVHYRQLLYFVDEVGFKLHNTIVIEKTLHVPPYDSSPSYNSPLHYVLCLSKGKAKVYNYDAHVSKIWAGPTRSYEEIVLSIIEKGAVSGDIIINSLRGHPAKTARWLVRDLILMYSKEGDTILDPFSGSGTTIEEAEKIGRIGIGIEINPNYGG